ncbi:putative phosphoesterase [Enterococcus sp. PF1-24]|uniref:metallophosphoesterase n=1 Tax=unclassified Enterococcus TaxID=2608891 RepID=UPI002473882A|nr:MULTISPECIES: metallophosphoesterase [unclassified Enterococcus]MDH6363031.1 putative phosphoesterase [Enterococcus sp. PFB1-1]MDH6400125.1 putative phosphoesterase [Enterococcus sp. PF1-24]
MKYLVVSDNHGNRPILVDIQTTYQGKIDYFFHCGDSELSPQDELWQTFKVVRGNCDYDPQYPESLTIETGEDCVFITHGHLVNVGFGLNRLELKAEEAQATIALFGHTHQIGCEMHNQTLFLNPGSVSQPRGKIMIPAYAIIDATDESYEVQYYRRNHQKIPELHFLFKK